MVDVKLASDKERHLFRRFWRRVHGNNDQFLDKVVLKEKILLKNNNQLFLIDKSIFSTFSFCFQSMLSKVPRLNLIHLGLFVGWIEKEFKPSLGFLHVIDHDNCHEVELPPTLIGAFTRGKLLHIMPSIKVHRFEGKFTKKEVFVTKSAGLTLGLSIILPKTSAKKGVGELHPLLHVGLYLGSESGQFRLSANNNVFK